MHIPRRTRFAGALAALVAAVVAPVGHAATVGPVFGLRADGNPKLGYFVYPLAPGSSRSGAIIITNTGDQTGIVKLYPADGSTGRTTGTVYLTSSKPSRTGTWITLAKSSLTLAPGAYERVPFTVNVPSTAKPGEWVAGLVAETLRISTSTRTKQKAGVQIRIRNQTIVAVQVNVPGSLSSSFRVGAVSTGGQRGYQQVIFHLTSTGNALVKPTGKVMILKAGKLVETLPFRMDTFLPQTSIDYPVLLKTALAPGSYEARISLDYANGTGTGTVTGARRLVVSKTDVKQVFASAPPTKRPARGSGGRSTSWVLAAVGAALVLALLGAFALLRRRRRDSPPVERGAGSDPPLSPPPPSSAPPAVAPARSAPAPPAAGRPVAPALEPTSRQPPTRTAPGEACVGSHQWEVSYEQGAVGSDGAWRFPHRCRACGLELLATDIADARAQAEAPTRR